MNKPYYIKKICGICGGKNLTDILNLKKMPISNAFLKKDQLSSPEKTFPLAIQLCKNCKSLQLRHIVSPELIFNNYSYETGASRPLVEHFHKMAEEIADDHISSPTDLVIEIGSNDGSLLSHIKQRCRVLGVDPADNIASIAEENGVPTVVGFFNTKLSKKIKSDAGEAKVIVANNVMAHIDDIRNVFTGVRDLLSSDGQFIFEVHWVGNLLTDGGFDQIYHEHFYYHSLHSLKYLLDSLGMVVKDIKIVPIHGESIRIYAGLSGASSKAVDKFLDREIAMGLLKIGTYQHFSKKVEYNKDKLKKLLTVLKREGKKIVGYGAPAKGNTLLNYFNIGPDILDYITDTTLAKQGMYTPGAHIPVVSPEILKKETPDYMLLLSWNYANAILEKEKELRDSGVKFIIPVPDVRIV